ncbi:hypothetical protein [Streptomyces sp. SLBN-31]|uniref:hypothetical protein n=1 Tax=Streptomyces sp. SLBN-31 TaxID=2768444 RepID=UPI001154A3B1|nr:hypothetical protein [Streptomyces sp. SLBN-31]
MVEIENGKTFVSGTAVRMLSTSYVQRSSGILVPERFGAPIAPIDLIKTYVTYEELVGGKSELSAVIETLKRISVFQVLGFTSHWLARYYDPRVDHAKLDREYAELHFQGPVRIKAISLVGESRALVVPQLLHALAKIAIIYCSAETQDVVDVGVLGWMPLTLGDHLDQIGEIPDGENVAVNADGTPGVLARHMISNQHLNRPLDAASLMASFSRRWREIPRCNPHESLGSFEDLYRAEVGIDLDELESVVLAAWSHVSLHHKTFIPASYFQSCGLPLERTVEVLKKLATTVDGLRYYIANDMTELEGGLEWSIAPFERFPILAVDGGILVLDPRLLMRRSFGWLPYFDVLDELKGDKKRAGQLRDYAGRVSEIYALEILDSIAPRLRKSIFYEGDLRRAYGAKRKVVDAAIDYGDRWVIVDISTRQLMRESVAGVSGDTVKKDLDALVKAKAAQIQSTIDAIRDDEKPLTGLPGEARIFYPVVVASEGFPVNPITSSMIEEMLRRENLLQGPGVAPVQVVDIAELEIVEGVQEQGGPSFVDLLERKGKSGLWRASLRDYILVELRLAPKRPERLDRLWQGLFNRVIDKVKPR